MDHSKDSISFFYLAAILQGIIIYQLESPRKTQEITVFTKASEAVSENPLEFGSCLLMKASSNGEFRFHQETTDTSDTVNIS